MAREIICKECWDLLPESMYTNSNDEIIYSRCIECRRKYHRELKRKQRDRDKNKRSNRDSIDKMRRDLAEQILIYRICDVCGYDKHKGSITIVDIDGAGLNDMLKDPSNVMHRDFTKVIHQCVSMCLNCEQAYHNHDLDKRSGPIPTITENIHQDRLAQYVSSIILD